MELIQCRVLVCVNGVHQCKPTPIKAYCCRKECKKRTTHIVSQGNFGPIVFFDPSIRGNIVSNKWLNRAGPKFYPRKLVGIFFKTTFCAIHGVLNNLNKKWRFPNLFWQKRPSHLLLKIKYTMKISNIAHMKSTKYAGGI